MAALVALINVAYFLAIGGSVGGIRYLASAAAAVVCLAALAISWLSRHGGSRRILAIILAALMVASFADGAVTISQTIRAEPDPREVLRRISDAGYTLCYAGFWDAYKYEFLSGGQIRFIPYNSQDRTRSESLRRRSEPAPKCRLWPDGSVTPFVPEPRLIDRSRPTLPAGRQQRLQ
jgi:hypothetical protein